MSNSTISSKGFRHSIFPDDLLSDEHDYDDDVDDGDGDDEDGYHHYHH